MPEQNVGVDPNERVYVIKDQHGTAVISWDEVVDKIERYTLELTFEDAPKVTRGTIETYDHMRNLQEGLHKRWQETGEQSVAELSPQLVGLETLAVRAETPDGEIREFTVGTTDDWQPHHIEHRTDGTASPALREYAEVVVLND